MLVSLEETVCGAAMPPPAAATESPELEGAEGGGGGAVVPASVSARWAATIAEGEPKGRPRSTDKTTRSVPTDAQRPRSAPTFLGGQGAGRRAWRWPRRRTFGSACARRRSGELK
jgi:hypothetical protein